MKTVSLKVLAFVSTLTGLSALPIMQAQANDWNYPPKTKFESTLTRSEVHEQYLNAVKEGTQTTLNEHEGAQPRHVFDTAKTRSDVQEEYQQALKDGSLPQAGEAAATATAMSSESTLTREAVIAETLDWLRTQRGDVMMGGN